MRKKKKKKTENLNAPSQHHIIPTSRGGNDSSQNISIVNIGAHQNYHRIFVNMTPDEIIKYLVDYFWNGETKWLKIYINEKEE